MKKAFLVGINDYPGSGNDLAGCVNDTAGMKDLLVRKFGFETSAVRVLTNARATRAAILDGIGELVAKGAPLDVLVFHYSGHGTQVPDQDDDEAADHLDEALCPSDFSWDGVWIRDDDLSSAFAGLPKGTHLEVLLDCCHSGTGTREIALEGPVRRQGSVAATALPGRKQTVRQRFLAPPAALVPRLAAVGRRGRTTRVGALVRAKSRGLNHVLWAACSPAQYAADAEFGGKPGGAFTWHFCDAVRAADPDATRADILQQVRAGLTAGGFAQSTQLECAQKLRGGRLFEP